jgi:rare lipoprotein A
VQVKRTITSLLIAVLVAAVFSSPALAYSGVASWYDLPGNYTASGDIYESYDYTCASNVYSFGTYLAITYNGITRVCVVTDTGGFTALGRDVDLSYQMAADLGLLYAGVDYVDIEYVGYDSGWYLYKQY